MPADVAIHGAGPVGCALALLLKAQGTSVVLAGTPPAAAGPLRPIALSHASRLILERAGAWTDLAPTPIEHIHVSQQGGFGRAELRAADAGVPALGYVIDYRDLLAALRRRVDAAGVDVAPTAAFGALDVHAEGASDEMEEKAYAQEAVIALMATRPAAAATAWERFTPEGPLALLPLGGKLAVVWGMAPEKARVLCEAPESAFLSALGRAIGARAGELLSAGERQRAPLALRVRRSRTGERAAYIGNAAQTLHPV